tara:strand:- start:1 stop:150 length:150 start_codon:yes stop_codon:yes gene_type:complete
METTTEPEEIIFDEESIGEELAILEASDNGRCWWIYDYLTALLKKEKLS